jgi:hypothetical protein
MNGDHDPRADLPVPNRRPPGVPRRGYVPHDVVEPALVYEPPQPHRSLGGDPAMRKDLGLVLFVAGALAISLATWNVAGAVIGTALAPTPIPSSPIALATPTAGPGSPTPPATGPGEPSGSAGPSTEPSPTATPMPARKAVDVKIESRPAAAFVSEFKDTWCAAAAVQIALNVNGPDGRIDTSRAFQARIRDLQVRLTTRADSRNGGAGPLGMVGSLEELGKVDYELRVYNTRAEALRASARAISRTGHAAILLAWRGAHAWVMTGYRADADPVVFKDAKVTGAYILDPWYPRVSSIWGRSDKPGVFQDAAEMKRNYRPWKRPEGKYPARDGNFLVIIPLN